MVYIRERKELFNQKDTVAQEAAHAYELKQELEKKCFKPENNRDPKTVSQVRESYCKMGLKQTIKEIALWF